jgi:hypothetical protein
MLLNTGGNFMPCDRISTFGVQLEACNANLMFAALQDLGAYPRLRADGHTIDFGNSESIDCATGQAQLSRYHTTEQIKRAYSAAVVKATAKKFGWAPATQNTNQQFVFNRR